MGKLAKDFRYRHGRGAQSFQHLCFMSDARLSIFPVPVCFAVSASFFDDDKTRRRNREVDRFIDPTFAALCFRFVDEIIGAEGTGRSVAFRSAIERVRQPFWDRASGCAAVSIASQERALNHSGGTFFEMPERAISIVDQTVPAIGRVEGDPGPREASGGAMQFARQVNRFGGGARVNCQEFSDLGKPRESRIERDEQLKPVRDLEKDLVLPKNRLYCGEDFSG